MTITTGSHPPDLAILAAESNQGYGNWPLPSDRDWEIAALLDGLVQPSINSSYRTAIGPQHGSVLIAFAERMASLAVRGGAREHVRRGLLAAALAGSAADRREVLLVLPLLWRSADLLGLDPAREFAAVGALVGGSGGDVLAAFASRSEADRSIEAMGYVEGNDETGFRFERTW